MKVIKDYIEIYGNVPFSVKEINEIDFAIFSTLTYLTLDEIDISNKKVPINEVLTKFVFFVNREDFLKKGFIQKELYDFILKLVDKKRYKDLFISNYVYKLTNNEQFGALTIHLPNRSKVIAFEGTDDNLVSWEEDLAFANSSLAPADKDAISYLNQMISIFDKNIYVVGHSKGGRLAITSSMYLSRFKQNKIKNIYSFDGPGLLDEEIEKKEYQRIRNKILHYIPNYSVIGMILNHDIEDIVVKGVYIDIRSHSLFKWAVKGTSFERTSISNVSIKWHNSANEWLKRYTPDERKAIFRQIFNTFRDLGYTGLSEIISVKNLLNIILKARKYDDDTKKILKDFFEFTIKNLVK